MPAVVNEVQVPATTTATTTTATMNGHANGKTPTNHTPTHPAFDSIPDVISAFGRPPPSLPLPSIARTRLTHAPPQPTTNSSSCWTTPRAKTKATSSSQPLP